MVLQDGTFPDLDSFQNKIKIGPHRSLQQSSTCSGPLTVGSTSIPFDHCEVIYPTFNFYYTMVPSAGTKTLLKGGMLVKTTGWASFARSPTQTMIGSDAIIVYPDASSLSGASVTGIELTSYEASVANRDKGTFPLGDASAVKNADGSLAATFTIEFPEAPSTFEASPMPYLWVINGMMGPNNGELAGHSGMGSMTSGGQLQFKLSSNPNPVPSTPTTTSPGNSTMSVPSQVHSPITGAPAVPSVPSPPPVPSCIASIASEVKIYRACYSVPFGTSFKVYYNLEADPLDPKSTILSMAMQAKSSGWVAIGFPSEPGQMTNAAAVILSVCPTCPTRAAINQYWMSGIKLSDVNLNTKLNMTEFTASAVGETISGSWKMKLSGVSVTTSRRRRLLQLKFPASAFPLIYAVGPVSSVGALQQHTLTDSGDGKINLLSGMAGAVGGQVETTISTNDIYKTCHMWIAAASWGIIIPISIFVARYLQPHMKVWFILHRVLSVTGFMGAIAALVLGLKVNNWQWETKYVIHRNLGITCTALGVAQVLSLITWLRPNTESKYRKYWKFFHSWFGRFAAVIGIGNIYYAIFFIEKLSIWAWIAYTAILSGIVVVSFIMEIVNWRIRRKERGDGEWKVIDSPTKKKKEPPPRKRFEYKD